ARAAEDAEKTRAEGVENAKLEAERIVKAAAGAKDKIREEITVEKTREAPKLALRIFKETLSEKAKAVIHEELVKEVAGRIKGIEKSRFSVKVKKGELASAFSLKKDDRDAILAAVFDRLGERIPFEDKEESGLIAGIVVKLGSLIIDGSLVNRLKQVGEGLGKE
ncbi:MAG: F0F1 ATP synthase subunit delta, partial [Candidatus Omnitrophica bacterium]|nr:F0F1 ATP synthase subunit delta [Candidatus Omnitrophota bacterium]